MKGRSPKRELMKTHHIKLLVDEVYVFLKELCDLFGRMEVGFQIQLLMSHNQFFFTATENVGLSTSSLESDLRDVTPTWNNRCPTTLSNMEY